MLTRYYFIKLAEVFGRSESLTLSKARRPPALAEIRGQAGPRASPTSKALARRQYLLTRHT